MSFEITEHPQPDGSTTYGVRIDIAGYQFDLDTHRMPFRDRADAAAVGERIEQAIAPIDVTAISRVEIGPKDTLAIYYRDYPIPASAVRRFREAIGAELLRLVPGWDGLIISLRRGEQLLETIPSAAMEAALDTLRAKYGTPTEQENAALRSKLAEFIAHTRKIAEGMELCMSIGEAKAVRDTLMKLGGDMEAKPDGAVREPAGEDDGA